MDTKAQADRARFGPFAYDLHSCELWLESRCSRLQEQPAQVLRLLLERPGQIVTREEARRALWPSDTFVDFDNGLNVAISKIRQALGDSATSPTYVETVPRRGYRFIAPIEWDSTAPVERSVGGTLASVPVPPRQRVLGIPMLASVGLVLITVSVGLLAVGWRAVGQAVAPASTGRSIAVLPFADYTGNSDQAYLADSITDGLITDLAALGVPRVISRQSVMRYRGSTQAAQQVGKDLGVDLLVQGSLSRSATGFLVNVQVIDAGTDRNLWAGRYQRLTTGEATTTDDLASAIAGHLGLVASNSLAERWAGRRSINPEARDEYLRGRFYWNKRTDAGMRQAAGHLQAAVRAQRDYALAWAGLADLYAIGGASAFGPTGPTIDGRPVDGVELAREALRLDPSLGEARAALGKMLMAKWEWRGALNELHAAVELSPQYATGRQWYGTLLARLQKCDEAIAQVVIGAHLDPLTPIINEAVGSTYMMCDKPELAIPVLERLVQMHPDFATARHRLGAAYDRTGRTSEAVAQFNRALELAPDSVLIKAALGSAYTRSGNIDRARQALREIDRACLDDPECDFARAILYAAMNDPAAMFRSLERAAAGRADTLDNLLANWRFREYRNDARFKRVVALLGLTPFDTPQAAPSSTSASTANSFAASDRSKAALPGR